MLVVGFLFSFQLYYPSKIKALPFIWPKSCVAAAVVKTNVKDQQREAVGWAHFTVHMFAFSS